MAEVYFRLHYEHDDIASASGSAWIVPVRWGSAPGRPMELSHDCGSPGELERVIDTMIADLKAIRRKAPAVFAAGRERRMRERGQ